MEDWKTKFLELERKVNSFEQSNSVRAEKTEKKLQSLCTRVDGFEALGKENRRRIVELEVKRSPSDQIQQVNISNRQSPIPSSNFRSLKKVRAIF